MRSIIGRWLVATALAAISCAAPAGGSGPARPGAEAARADGTPAASGDRAAARDSNDLWATLRPTPEPPPAERVPRVITRGDRFEIAAGGAARPVFFRGVNLGAGAPGHFPGEFAFTKEDYRRYLRFARELHANAVRVYALHPPAFYQALLEENEKHPDDPIWLFQEVWTELPENDDFWDRGFTRDFDREIRLAVDAIHGNADVKPRPGHASGRYDADVSRYVAGWLLGREWEPYAVRVTEARHPDSTSYRGAWFGAARGSAMETWLARALDLAASYEASRYGVARALAFVNWPTLDVMRHPTETERGGREAEHDEDAYSVDPTRIAPTAAALARGRCLGYFANYHVYPYYPDFMNLDPGYSATRDRHGPCNYAGYLRDLKAHSADLPLLIGEYGVPSSRGIAHLQPQGIDHGGSSEVEQGERDVRLLQDIEDAGCAGSLLFSLFDEWFKVNWLVRKMEAPRDRDPLWHNLLDPEENYGLIGFDPPPRIRVDGDASDWAGIAPYASADSAGPEGGGAGGRGAGGIGEPIRALYATSDQNRFYLRFDLEPGALDRRVRALGVSLDVLDPARGDRRLPAPLSADWSRGAEFVLVVRPGRARGAGGRDGKAELFVARDMNWSGWSRLRAGGSFEPDRAPFRTPAAVDRGDYVPLLVETNRERVARNGTLYPARLLDWGRLSYGREPVEEAAWPGAEPAFAYDPHAEWCVSGDGREIEVALPWGLLNVGDPSSLRVVDDDPRTPETETTPTRGIGLLAWATAADGFEPDSLGPGAPGAERPVPPGESQFLGAPGTSQRIAAQSVEIDARDSRSYVWNGWEAPITSLRIKRSATFVRQAFEGMESRERRENKGLDARR